jgi:hypothetical protein
LVQASGGFDGVLESTERSAGDTFTLNVCYVVPLWVRGRGW